MLRITLTIGSRAIAVGDIGIKRMSQGVAEYSIRLRDDFGEVREATLKAYPRWSGSVWDLVARGITLALSGRERLPARPRPVVVPIHRDGDIQYVRLSEIPEPARSGFTRNIAHSTCPIVPNERDAYGCAYAHDWYAFLDGWR